MRAAGFTLVEVAIVVAIVGLLLGSLTYALSAQVGAMQAELERAEREAAGRAGPSHQAADVPDVDWTATTPSQAATADPPVGLVGDVRLGDAGKAERWAVA